MRYMLDTNICIYAIKHKPEQAFKRLQEHDPSEICISSVTYAELVHGVEKSKSIEKNRLALALLLANIEIISFDSLAAESYGKIGESYCGEWDYLCVRRGQYLLSGFTIARRNKL